MSGGAGGLSFGSNVVELLLPQRRPMLMVDRVDAFAVEPSPTLTASRYVSANEIFFEGHLPGLHLWPGCLTIEGMGQTGQLLVAILAVRRAMVDGGRPADAALEALANLDLGFRLHPGYRADDAAAFLAGLRGLGPSLGLAAAVDVKLVHPVFAGQRLDYRATLVGELGDMVRLDVEASVGKATVAHGAMTGVRVRTSLPRLAEP